MNYKSAAILYNPNSTGPSKENAETFKDVVGKKLDVKLIETAYAGHGEELAKEYAQSGEPILLVSSSGDGGYHELINGVMEADFATSKVVLSLLPSGNANDHHTEVGSSMYYEHVLAHHVKSMDLIKVVSTIDGKQWTRYAHSYVGFGVSAHIGKQLTNASLNIINEKLIVLKNLLSFRYVLLQVNDSPTKYSSLVFSNIGRMSKVLTLANDSSVNDGKIEVNQIIYSNVLKTLFNLIRMIFTDISNDKSITRFQLKTINKTRVQLDGEDYVFDQNVDVKIEVIKSAIRFVA